MNNFEQILNRIIRDLGTFLNYLKSIWGLLSVTTAFFPLLNSFTQKMPLPRVSTSGQDFCVVLSTIICIFILFFQFATRDDPYEASIAARTFFAGTVIAVFYVYVLPLWPTVPIEQVLELETVTPRWQILLGVLRAIVGGSFEPVLYLFVFALFTYAFGILAVVAYQKQRGRTSQQ
jgi:hypothetical protein